VVGEGGGEKGWKSRWPQGVLEAISERKRGKKGKKKVGGSCLPVMFKTGSECKENRGGAHLGFEELREAESIRVQIDMSMLIVAYAEVAVHVHDFC
jgi:hypothetical protein